jgi:transcriptional regulator with XRE-family HTH domain
MRLKLGASQEDFAKIMDCSQQFISYIELGERRPTHEQLTELCKHYVCTFEDLGYTVQSKVIIVPITEDHAITTRAAKQA